ncbi:MAG: glycosyltransferase [Ignavibacteriales bacterium]|nr:glycosyltransferase [Ignavibacteriales bacterium]
MISNRDIIIFGDDWGRFPSTIQHIGKVLSKTNRILWIGSLGLRKPELKLKDLKRVFEKVSNLFERKNIESEKLPVIELHPFVLPFHDFEFVRKLNKKFIISSIRKKISELKFQNPILITSSPIIADLIGEFNESSAHYFCLDDYTLFDGAFKSLLILEKQLLGKVDSCFSISDVLMKSRIPKSGKSYFLPQGVESGHFTSASIEIPNEIKNLKKPVIGFFGLLAPWINIDLICKSACNYPEYTFLIIGKPATDISQFDEIKNLKFVGEIPYKELPAYAKVFDVGLIPFKVNELTIAANPIKLLEYLSMGIPVVSTDLPEAAKFKDYIFIAKDDKEFINQIQTAVLDNQPIRNKARMIEAEKYSWQSITENISKSILEIEKAKKILAKEVR